jgi:hypothetical protein
MTELGFHPLEESAHIDISAEVLEGLLTLGNRFNVVVGQGISEEARIDDITWDPFNRKLRLHFDRRVKEPVLYEVRAQPEYKLWLGEHD